MIKAELLISGGKDKLVIKWHQDKWLLRKSINPTSHTHIPRWMKDINMYLIGILEEEDRENTKKKKLEKMVVFIQSWKIEVLDLQVYTPHATLNKCFKSTRYTSKSCRIPGIMSKYLKLVERKGKLPTKEYQLYWLQTSKLQRYRPEDHTVIYSKY